jgi:hypothetical protein
MPDLRLEIILIGLLIIGALLLVISYTWVFIIQRSPLKLFMMVLRSALDRDRLVDPNAPIEMRKNARRAQSFIDQGNSVKNSALFPEAPVSAQSVGAPPPRVVPHAPLNETDLHTADETTSDNGWPRRMDKATRQSRRPFLRIELDSDQDTNPNNNQS